ncbi:MAG: hypothetical protein ACI91B_002996 [Planctomycetota bacterium]
MLFVARNHGAGEIDAERAQSLGYRCRYASQDARIRNELQARLLAALAALAEALIEFRVENPTADQRVDEHVVLAGLHVESVGAFLRGERCNERNNHDRRES